MERNPRCSARRPERKTIEKNRRNQMKALHGELQSLIHCTTTRKGSSSPPPPLPLPEMIEEATNYIKGLQERVERTREGKMGQSTRSSRTVGGGTEVMKHEVQAPLKEPLHVEVQDLGCGMQVLVVGGDRLMLPGIVRILQDEGAEILTASYTAMGEKNLALHTVNCLVTSTRCSSREEISESLEKLKKSMWRELNLSDGHASVIH